MVDHPWIRTPHVTNSMIYTSLQVDDREDQRLLEDDIRKDLSSSKFQRGDRELDHLQIYNKKHMLQIPR